MKHKDSYVNLSNQSDQQMKYVKAIQLIMCKIKKYNLINDKTAKTKSNASETEQHDIFPYITTCKNTFEIAVLIFTPKPQVSFSIQNIPKLKNLFIEIYYWSHK